MRRNGHKTTPGQIFNPKFETPMGCFLFDYEFWWCFLQDLWCFERKTVFVMQNFRNLGASGVCWPFFDETPKRYILAWFHAFWAIMRAHPFMRFDSRRPDKKGTLQKVTETLYFTYLRGIHTQPNLTKIGMCVGVADMINHTKFSNDRSREYKVTEGRISPCSIGMACRL